MREGEREKNPSHAFSFFLPFCFSFYDYRVAPIRPFCCVTCSRFRSPSFPLFYFVFLFLPLASITYIDYVSNRGSYSWSHFPPEIGILRRLLLLLFCSRVDTSRFFFYFFSSSRNIAEFRRRDGERDTRKIYAFKLSNLDS